MRLDWGRIFLLKYQVKFTIYEENDISKRKSKAPVKVLYKNKYGNNFELK